MDRARKFFNGNRGNLGEDKGDSQAKSTARVSSFFHPRTASEIKRRVYYRIIIVAASILFFVWCLAEAGAYTAPANKSNGQDTSSGQRSKVPGSSRNDPSPTLSSPGNMSSNGSSTPVIGVEEQVTDELVVKSGDVSKDTDDPGTPVSDAVHGDTPGVDATKIPAAGEGADLGAGLPGSLVQVEHHGGVEGTPHDAEGEGGGQQKLAVASEDSEQESRVLVAKQKSEEGTETNEEETGVLTTADGEGERASGGNPGMGDRSSGLTKSENQDAEHGDDSKVGKTTEDGGEKSGSRDASAAAQAEYDDARDKGASHTTRKKGKERKSVEDGRDDIYGGTVRPSPKLSGEVEGKGGGEDDDPSSETESILGEPKKGLKQRVAKEGDIEEEEEREVKRVGGSKVVKNKRGTAGEEEEGEEVGEEPQVRASKILAETDEADRLALVKVAESGLTKTKKKEGEEGGGEEREGGGIGVSQGTALGAMGGGGGGGATVAATASEQGLGQGSKEQCAGRYVYIYPLPQKFNRELLEQCETMLPWYNMCPHFQNDGLGKKVTSAVLTPQGRWFETHQFTLEVIFHNRLRRAYPCLTTNAEEADLLYIPYYAALDAVHWNFAKDATTEDKDELSLALTHWVSRKPHFKRYEGLDHLMVIGRATWDFRRKPKADWGNVLLEIPLIKKMMKVLIESDVFDSTEVGVPVPTHFHPRTERDFKSWQKSVFRLKRSALVSFAAMSDVEAGMKEALTKQCQEKSSECRYMECIESVCMGPGALMDLYMSSHFCLIPSGGNAAKSAGFSALVAGCIPVIFDDFFTQKQFKWHLPADNATFAHYIVGDDVKSGSVNVIEALNALSTEEVEKLRMYIVWTLLPRLVYKHPRSPLTFLTSEYKDAFDVIIEGALEKAKQQRALIDAENLAVGNVRR